MLKSVTTAVIMLWLCILAYLHVATAETSLQDLSSLLDSIPFSSNTSVSFPGQAEFTSATQRWTTFSSPTYFAAISPGSEHDLVQIVSQTPCPNVKSTPLTNAQKLRLATTNNIPFLATSGRHGFNPTLGGLQNGLAIDLSLFDRLDVDAASGTMTVGPAVRTGDLLKPVFEAGYEIRECIYSLMHKSQTIIQQHANGGLTSKEIGTCTCPSFIGVTIGAGIGRWQGVYGLYIDALQSVRFIAANGTALTASETQNPELFWGIRGAGANLGLITEATYQLHKITNDSKSSGQGLNADFIFSAEKNASYFAILEELGQYPAELAIVTVVMWNETVGEAQLLSNWMYFGPEEEGMKLIAPMLDLGPSVASVNMVPFTELLHYQGFGIDASLCADNLVRDLYTASIRTITAITWQATFSKMADFYDAYPEARALSVLELETYPNQATTSVPDDETAYPWRDATGYLAFQFGWPENASSSLVEASAALGRELRTDFAATSGYENEPGLEGGLAVYVNYAHGDEPLESIYGADKLPRLAALKKMWDPDNIFAYHLALPTEYP